MGFLDIFRSEPKVNTALLAAEAKIQALETELEELKLKRFGAQNKQQLAALANSRWNKARAEKAEARVAEIEAQLVTLKATTPVVSNIDYETKIRRLQNDLNTANAKIRSLQDRVGESEHWWTAAKVKAKFPEIVAKAIGRRSQNATGDLGKVLYRLATDMGLPPKKVPTKSENFPEINSYWWEVVRAFVLSHEPNFDFSVFEPVITDYDMSKAN